VNKNIFVVLLVILAILAVLGFVFKGKFLKPTSPSADKQDLGEKQKEEFSFKWQQWEDLAGFAFEYPKGVEIDDHPEDEENYAHLELTKADKKGRIGITVNDAEYTDVDEWLENDELLSQGSALETEIASMSGKKIALENGREVAVFIDWDQVFYKIDSQAEGEDYWRQAYARILSSFKLIPLEGETEEDFADWLGGFDTSGVDIIEAVEVIE